MNTGLQPIDVRHKAEKLNLRPKDFSIIFDRSLVRVYDAYKGKAPRLLTKINNYVELLKPNRNVSAF